MTVRAVMVGVGNNALINSAGLLHAEAEHLFDAHPRSDRDNVALLMQGADATKANVLQVITDLAHATERDDVLIISFSAHATTGAGDHREWVSLADTAMSDIELNAAIAKVRPSARVVLIADACRVLGLGDDNTYYAHHVIVGRSPDGVEITRPVRDGEQIVYPMPASERDLAPPGPNGVIRVPLDDLNHLLLEMPASTQDGTTSSDATCTKRGTAETVTCSAYMSALVRALRQTPTPSFEAAHEAVRRELGGGPPHARLYVPGDLHHYAGPLFTSTPFFAQPTEAVPAFELADITD